MARCQKYARSAAGHMFAHFERAKDENGEYVKFSNQNIDSTKTPANILFIADKAYLQDMPHPSLFERYKKRLSELSVPKRKDLKTFCSWVITLPKGLKDAPIKEKTQFFVEANSFVKNRYGAENVIAGALHLDEVTPHIHISFIPEFDGRVCAKNVITRLDLSTFHKDLSAKMTEVYGRDIGVENDTTKQGNLSTLELKRKDALEFDLRRSKLEKVIIDLEDKITAKNAVLDELEEDLGNMYDEAYSLSREISHLEIKRDGLIKSVEEHSAEWDDIQDHIAAADMLHFENLLAQQQQRRVSKSKDRGFDLDL